MCHHLKTMKQALDDSENYQKQLMGFEDAQMAIKENLANAERDDSQSDLDKAETVIIERLKEMIGPTLCGI